MKIRSMTWQSFLHRGLLVSAILVMNACVTDDAEPDPKPSTGSADFIPAKGHKYVYKVESEGGSAEATRWISAETDSVGINVSNMLTEISAFGQAIVINDAIFSIKGKTYTQIKLPDAWYQSIQMLDALPDIEIVSSTTLGYPAYLTIDNVIKEGSKLEIDGPLQQEQHVEYTDHGKAGSMAQVLLTHAGAATVETLSLASGSFVCSKFTYKVAKTITITVDGKTDTMDGVEDITLWVAHGIGMVKQESSEESAILMPTATGGVKLVKTSSSSTTTLHNIK
ncbi:hypothetical protein WBG78_04665 [Chryseolinea sp. T2]|uniref:TapB family protein n=1 Tax=Chryseolinea sp. T2 TaxID=3129255 RepID=UPI0030780B56